MCYFQCGKFFVCVARLRTKTKNNDPSYFLLQFFTNFMVNMIGLAVCCVASVDFGNIVAMYFTRNKRVTT